MLYDELLTSCARVLCGTGDTSGLPDVLARLPAWDGAIDRARRENLSPVVYTALNAAGLLDTLPTEAWRALESDYWNSRAASLLIESELHRIAGLLQHAGISFMVTKGAALLGTTYEDPALRLMSDVDLVVRKQDFDAACAAISACLDYEYRADMHRVYRELTHAVFCRTSGFLMTFEVHQSLLGDIALLAEEEVWNEAVPHFSGGLTLCPEDMLVHLCAHAALRHQLRSLSQLLDVALLIARHSGLDWDMVKSRAVKLGAARVTATALEMAGRYMGAAVPPDVLAELKAARGAKLRELAMALVTDAGERHCLRILGRWALMPDLKTKARYAAWNLLPPARWLSSTTGKSRWAVYPHYAFRICRAFVSLLRFAGRKILTRSRALAQRAGTNT